MAVAEANVQGDDIRLAPGVPTGEDDVMASADMGGSGSTDLKRGLEALKTFKKRVDDVLINFEDSPGSSTKVAAQKISRASFSGTGKFDEASALYSQYERVHERLTSLSKTLGLQIEAMRIAVHGADVGFDNLEEELRQRFARIQAEVHRDHQDGQREKAGVPEQQRSDNKQSRAGY
ncbi:hypothetical protein ABT009_17770 [Streptomyces sp. NPDC002896]|uniref:hypothetical protein n=1 Tax=Streptomyces sp. NPDC002896 TaxID=3154438 RepID=UPI00331A5A81